MTADWDRTGEKVIVSVDFTDEAVATVLRAGSAVPEQLSHSSFLREGCGRLALDSPGIRLRRGDDGLFILGCASLRPLRNGTARRRVVNARFLSFAVIPPTLARLGTYRMLSAEDLPSVYAKSGASISASAANEG